MSYARLWSGVVTHVHSTFHICWGAQARGFIIITYSKYILDKKISGVFSHKVLNKVQTVQRFDDAFYAPHSPSYGSESREYREGAGTEIMAASEEADVYVVGSADDSQFFIMGHSEYDVDTLAKE